MQNIVVILSGILHHGLIAGLHPVSACLQLNKSFMQGLFNGQFLFVMKFLGEVLMVLIMSWIIGKLLHLDKVDKSDYYIDS
jgi:hypothetical protein